MAGRIFLPKDNQVLTLVLGGKVLYPSFDLQPLITK
jgi:hypothetical protein